MSNDTITKTYIITPAAGKRLIAKALAQHPLIQEALKTRNVLIVAGTTNGYVAEEILASLGQSGVRAPALCARHHPAPWPPGQRARPPAG